MAKYTGWKANICGFILLKICTENWSDNRMNFSINEFVLAENDSNIRLKQGKSLSKSIDNSVYE